MGRVILIFITAGLFISFGLTQAQAGWFNKKEEKQEKQIKKEEISKPQADVVKQADATKVDKEKEIETAKKNELLTIKMGALNNTRWQIEMVSMSAKQEKQTASLVFKDRQVSSTFAEGDFPASNFTSSLGEDGSLVWETMQTGESQGVLFWRGELSKDTASMRGILSHQLPDKTNQDYSFSSIKKEAVSASQ